VNKNVKLFAVFTLAAILLLGASVSMAFGQPVEDVDADPAGPLAPGATSDYTVTVSISPTFAVADPAGGTRQFHIIFAGVPAAENGLGQFGTNLQFDHNVIDVVEANQFGNTWANIYIPGLRVNGWLGNADTRSWSGGAGYLGGDPDIFALAGNSTDAGSPGPSGEGVAALYKFECQSEGTSDLTLVGDFVANPDNDQYNMVISNTATMVCGAIPTYTLNTGVVGSGSVTRDPDAASYDMGTTVALEAVPADACWSFDHWEGDPLDGSTENPVDITMNEDYTITAHFIAPTFTLTVDTVGNGTVTKDPDQAAYDCGESVDLTADAGANARFVEWSGADAPADPTENPTTLNMDANKVLTATFVDTHTVTFDSDPDGGTVGVEDENGDGIYDDGETITVTATRDPCYEFAGWTDDLVGEPNPAVVTVGADMNFAATFTVMTSTLSVNVAPMDAKARVDITPDQTVFNCGDTVTATAEMTAPWSFDQWIGAMTSSDNPDSFVIGEDATTVLTGHFLSTYLVTLPATDTVDGGTYDAEFDPEDCTDNGDGEYECDPNAVITFTATADTCYDFDVWTGDVPSGHEENNPLALTVQANMAVTPTFTLIQFDTLTVTVEPAGMGNTAMVEPTSGPYICGQTMVTATATATDTWSFNAWSGAVESTDNPVTFTMGEEQTLTATFKQYKIYLPLVARNFTPEG
jgi:hypothetical protein